MLKNAMEDIPYTNSRDVNYLYNSTVLFCLFPTEMCVAPYQVGYEGAVSRFGMICRNHNLHCLQRDRLRQQQRGPLPLQFRRFQRDIVWSAAGGHKGD